MRCYVEPSPAGGYHVRLRGSDAPVSRHDTEEEAEEAAAAYQRGLEHAASGAEYVTLRDGSEVIVRQVRPEDKPLFVAGWERFGEGSRYKRFMGHKRRLTMDELVRFTEIDHVDHEAIGALDSRAREGLGVARYLRLPRRPDVAEVAVAVIDAWQGRGLFRRLGDVHVIGSEGRIVDIDVELPVAAGDALGIALRTAATGHVGRRA